MKECAEPAMNTIPTTFNERKVPHTIVGGKVAYESTAAPQTAVEKK